MHVEAFKYVQEQVRDLKFDSVVEFGSLNINGSVRTLFNCEEYHGIDLQSGSNVDEIADAAIWRAEQPVDAIVCCEVLEHAHHPWLIVDNAARNLRPYGLFLMTCATTPRRPHSAVDGGPIRPGEYYLNVEIHEFSKWCRQHFRISSYTVSRERGDLYVTARRLA